MSERTDVERPDDAKEKPAAPSKKPASDAPPVSGPNAPAAGRSDEEKTESNRKGGYGTG